VKIRRFAVTANKPTWVIGLTKTVQDMGLAEVGRPEFTPINPANSIILKLRKTNSRNEVTVKAFSIASYGMEWSRLNEQT
jgi:hypothetical protein